MPLDGAERIAERPLRRAGRRGGEAEGKKIRVAVVFVAAVRQPPNGMISHKICSPLGGEGRGKGSVYTNQQTRYSKGGGAAQTPPPP